MTKYIAGTHGVPFLASGLSYMGPKSAHIQVFTNLVSGTILNGNPIGQGAYFGRNWGSNLGKYKISWLGRQKRLGHIQSVLRDAPSLPNT